MTADAEFRIADPATREIDLGAARLYATDAVGQLGRPPVLMVHGAFHGPWAFAPWARILARLGYPSYRIALRNHVPGEAPDAGRICETTMHAYARDVGNALDHIGEAPILIGHSLGGLVCQMIAVERAAGIRALVLIGSAGPGELGETRDFDWPEDEPLLFPPDRMRKSMFAEIDNASFAEIYARLVPESPRALNQSGRGQISIDPSKLGAPCLVLGTEHDGIGLHSAESIAAYLGAECRIVPGTSHDCLLEPAGFSVLSECLTWLVRRRLELSEISS